MKQLLPLFIGLVFLAGCKIGCVDGNGNLTVQDRAASNFHSVSSSGSFEVMIAKSNAPSIRVEAESNLLDHLKTEVKNGRVEIYYDGCVDANRTTRIWLGMSEVKGLELSGSGQIIAQDTFVSDRPVQYKVSGSGNVKVPTKAHTLTADISGSGDIETAGVVSVLNVNITGSGGFNGTGLNAELVHANIAGSGNAEIGKTLDLDASITGSGSVYYKGNPKIRKNVNGSGNVEPR